MTTTSTTDDTTVAVITLTITVWVFALGLTLLWWNDLGVERFEEFVGRVMIVIIAALGVTMSAIVAVLASRHS